MCLLAHRPYTARCLSLQAMDEAQHTIVIVGAGPTGLALGAELKRLGIPRDGHDRFPIARDPSARRLFISMTARGISDWSPVLAVPNGLRAMSPWQT